MDNSSFLLDQLENSITNFNHNELKQSEYMDSAIKTDRFKISSQNMATQKINQTDYKTAILRKMK